MIECFPLLVPIVSLYLVSTGFVYNIIPEGFEKFVMLFVLYLLTVALAKYKCWEQDITVSVRALAPVSIFVGWLILHYIPLTSGIMYAIGDNVFVIIALSAIFKTIYDAPKVFGEC